MTSGAAALIVVGLLGLSTVIGDAAEPDWAPIQYGDGVGGGLFVRFFDANGGEPTVEGKATAFFPGGAPPGTSEFECLSRCSRWAESSIVKTLAIGYRKNLGVTRVTGTGFLQRRPLGPPRVVAVD
jgi:hypothetical protein